MIDPLIVGGAKPSSTMGNHPRAIAPDLSATRKLSSDAICPPVSRSFPEKLTHHARSTVSLIGQVL